MFKKITLDNGLRIITAPMQGTNTVTTLVLCGTGSDYESQEISGISHFLEHMFFKGTQKRPLPTDITHELDSMGSISNAFTSHELTGYFVKAGKEYLDRSFDILSDIYKNSLLNEEEIEREKQVVVEEMHKDRDNPMLYIWWVWEKLLYGDQPAGWDVIGTEEVIRKLKREDFVNYFFHQYVASNTAIVVAGNFEEISMQKRIEEIFGDIRHDPPVRKKADFREGQKDSALDIHYKETDQTHITLGFRGYDANHPQRYAAELLAAILGAGMSSRMFTEIRERLGLAYAVSSVHESYSNRGYLVTYAGVAHENVEKTIRAILGEYGRLCEEKVSDKEFKKVKDYIRGTTLIALESSNAVASFVGGEEMLTGKPLTIDEVFAKIDAVTPDQICAIAKDIMRPERLNLAMIGPWRDSASFIKLLREF
ncbi:MAG: insulinase family protein [Candidatus Sungbacteria bacterium]|nr:insulinase family protein [Candidatus Sungbacteria bacterium]